jgi:hypothetical protein
MTVLNDEDEKAPNATTAIYVPRIAQSGKYKYGQTDAARRQLES